MIQHCVRRDSGGDRRVDTDPVMRRRHWLIRWGPGVVLGLFLFPLLAGGQGLPGFPAELQAEPDAPAESPAEETGAEPAPLELSEIPIRLERSVVVVRRVVQSTESRPITAIRQELPNLASSLRAILAQNRSRLGTSGSPALIRTLRDIWSGVERDLDGWQSSLRVASAAIEDDLATLAEETLILEAAQEELEAAGAEPETMATIGRVQQQIAQAEAVARERRNEMLGLQARVAEISIEIELTREELSEIAASERGRIFRLNGPPIWAPSPGSVDAGPEPLPETIGAIPEIADDTAESESAAARPASE